MTWRCDLSKKAKEDYILIKNAGLKNKTEKLLLAIEENPFVNPPSYEKLENHDNRYSRRIDLKHRLVYEVYKEERTIKILRMWSHYE